MDWYAGLLRQYGPPGSVNFNWNEALAAFAQGQVAQFFDGANFAIQFEDKDKSKIAGKVGYAPMPAGPKQQFLPTFTAGYSVSGLSKNKKPRISFDVATSKSTLKKCNSLALAHRARRRGTIPM